MRHLSRFVLAALLGFPLTAGAATSAELQAQADALLQQIAAIQAQLGIQQQTTAPVAVPPASCPLVGRILRAGSSGEDVTRLQQFLARDPSVYPEGMVTGYFGSLTEAAVKRWQAKYNIVSSGTPETTGFGQVGPRTAAAMSLQCSGGGGGTGIYGGYIQVSPITGAAPLTVKVTTTVNTAGSCSGGTYALNWGDGSPVANIVVPPGQCGQMVQDYAHQYIYGGAYTITLSAGSHSTSASVTVTGARAPTGGTGGGSSGTPATPSESFRASVVSGTVPLTVTFSGIVASGDDSGCTSSCFTTIDFGDGTTAQVPQSKTAAQNYSINHTYTKSGVFSATHTHAPRAPSTVVSGSPIKITVSGPAAGVYTQMSIAPSVGGNPLSVGVQFDITGCPSYSLSWGDGSAGPSAEASSSCTPAQSYTHTYAQAGTYTITLVRSSQTDTSTIAIHQ